MIGQKDELLEFMERVEAEYERESVGEFPLIKYNAKIAQETKEKKFCQVIPLEGGGVRVKGRALHEAIEFYKS